MVLSGLLRLVCLGVAFFSAARGAEPRFFGQVLSATQAPVAEARVLLRSPVTDRFWQQFADLRGRFSLSLPAAGSYLLTVEHEGFFPIRDRLVEVSAAGGEAVLTLEPLREIIESVDVTASPLSLGLDATSTQSVATASDIVNIPYPNTNDIRSALRIIPGIVRDQRGGLHVHGSAEDQVMYTLNGFNIGDPLTNRFDSRLSVESVQSVEVAAGSIPAEFGKGSGGTLAFRTQSGDDKFRYTATNFVPGFERQKGWVIGDFTPRLGFSGPIRRGRAWFANHFDTQYINTVIRDLPKGEDRSSSLRLSNLLSGQVNLTPSHILHTGFLINRWRADRAGLSVLTPRETTPDLRSRQWFFYVKDQIYLPARVLVEVGFAANRTFQREIPQGEGLLTYTPFGRSGFHFVNAVRKGGRDQFLVSGFLPSFSFGGAHQVKSGIDLDRVHYWQDAHRTGFENFSEEGWKIRRTVYGGVGRLWRRNYEAAWFVQDSWRVRPSLLLELGFRLDWANILRRWDSGLRAGAAWSPPGRPNTKLFGGVAQIFDAINLRIFTRPLDQYPLTTYFSPDGEVVRGPAVTVFTLPPARLARPRFHNWNAGLEHHWPGTLAVRAEYLRRRGSRGLSYLGRPWDGGLPQPGGRDFDGAVAVDSLLILGNERIDTYDAFTLTLRQNIRRQYEWSVSYTRSRALSNTVTDVSVEDPILYALNTGPMPWDAPHRLLASGYLPLPFKDWAAAFLIDTRNGFPFSTQRDDGALVGAVNTLRFPVFFEANLHFERRFAFRNHRWAFRFGSNNITSRRNPDTVNNIVTSSRYLTFYGGNNRSFNFRIRWLGRKQ